MSIPELFKCPITLDLFTDPVTLCTGQTYDRPSIQKWLAQGNLTCPVTMQKLTDLSLVPNHTLRHLIDRWIDTGRGSEARCSCSCPDDEYLAELKHKIQSMESSVEQKLQAVRQVRGLVLDRGRGLAESGIFESLIGIVIGHGREFTEGFVEEALECVVELIPFESDFGWLSCMVSKESFWGSFVMLLETGSDFIKLRLCQLIEAMAISLSSSASSSSSSSSSSLEVLESVCVIRGLINVAYCHDLNVSGSGVKAISRLCMIRTSLEIMTQEGVVDALIDYIMRAQSVEDYKNNVGSASGLAMRAIEVLMMLDGALGNGVKESLMRNPNGVKSLVKMVFRVSDHDGSKSAVNCLLSLCCESMEAREEAIELGVLTQLLFLLQSQCSGSCKSKARLLLKLLRSMWVKDPIACVRF